jgi:hypothetical protein
MLFGGTDALATEAGRRHFGGEKLLASTFIPPNHTVQFRHTKLGRRTVRGRVRKYNPRSIIGISSTMNAI